MITATATVADIMSKNVLFAHTGQSFTQLCRLFFEMDIHHLPVADEMGKLIGILSTNDVLKAYGRKVPSLKRADDAMLNEHITIYDLMTQDPISVPPGTTLKEAAQLLATHNIQSLPVVEGQKVVGIVTSRDLIRYLAGA
ncbi:MAG: CBS domain-containing protein [Lewinellaceae bacterium]|nr:CBS domain-containing protein [Phaeodactylibacter sp.]MCB9037061.1 CBS domain-containing protein [Lewinellaceae bacterium]